MGIKKEDGWEKVGKGWEGVYIYFILKKIQNMFEMSS